MKKYGLKNTFLILLLCGACTQEDDGIVPVPSGTPVALGVSNVSIAESHREIKEGVMWLWIRGENNYQAQVSGSQFLCAYNSGAWLMSHPVILNSNPISLYAYYPVGRYYPELESSGSSYVYTDRIVFESRKYDDAYDLCYATATTGDVTAANPYARFDMKHACARITLSITRAATFTAEGKITAFTLKAAKNGASINLKATLSPESGTIIPSNPSASGFTYSVTTTVVAGAPNTACDVLFIPQTVPDNGLQISLTIDGTSRSAVIPKSSFANGKLEDNKQYTIRLEIQPSAILTVGTDVVTEESWNEPSGGDFGNIDDIVA